MGCPYAEKFGYSVACGDGTLVRTGCFMFAERGETAASLLGEESQCIVCRGGACIFPGRKRETSTPASKNAKPNAETLPLYSPEKHGMHGMMHPLAYSPRS